MRQLAALVLSLIPASAQVLVKLTPEPMFVPTAQLYNAKQMGRWIIEGCNDGQGAVTIPWERISMQVADIRFIDNDDALIVLNSNRQKSVLGTIVRVGTVSGEALAIGLSVASRANQNWATGLSLGSSLAGPLTSVAAGQLPAVTPLISGTKYPLTLPPGACFTDHRFAVKMKDPHVETITMGGETIRMK